MAEDPQSVAWHPDILHNVARFLPGNDVACGLRLVNKAASAQFRDSNIIKLSQPSLTHSFMEYWCAPGRMNSLTFQQRSAFMRLTAASGCLANLEVAVGVAGVALMTVAAPLEAAAAAGHVEACSWLRERGCHWGDCLMTAARSGQRVVCEWLLEHGCTWSMDAVRAAAASGHVGLMDWLWQRNPSTDSDVSSYLMFVDALKGCDLATVQRLARDLPGVRTLVAELQPQEGQQPEPGSDVYRKGAYLLSAAARSLTPDWRAKMEWLKPLCSTSLKFNRFGMFSWVDTEFEAALDRLLWLRARGHRVDDELLYSIAGRVGDVARLQRLIDVGVPLVVAGASAFARTVAARYGRLAALQFLVECGVPADSSCALGAFRGGQLEVLQYLHGRGVRLEPLKLRPVIEEYIRCKRLLHLPVVRWAVETLGAEVAASCGLREAAAVLGSVDTLSWLRERGCPWSDRTFAAAVAGGSVETVEWLLESGCPVDATPYLPAARNGDPATLRCLLLRLDCPWDKRATFLACARDYRCELRVLQWLVQEEGCPVDWDEAVRVADEGRKLARNREEVLSWLGGGLL